jgi:hypothetical protein
MTRVFGRIMATAIPRELTDKEMDSIAGGARKRTKPAVTRCTVTTSNGGCDDRPNAKIVAR